MDRRVNYATLIAALFVLGGCASFKTVPFGGPAQGKVHVVGLVTVNTPPGLTVSVRAPTANNFGLIGEIIESSAISDKSNKFTAAAESLHYSIRDDLTKQLETDLSAEGYKVNPVPVTRTGDDFLKSYPPAAGCDAFLDVVVHEHEAGYRAAGDSTDYYPYLFVTARLVSASGSEVYYAEQVVYNPINPPEKARTIAPDQDYGYPDFDHLMANPRQSVEGLEEAVDKVAAAIASDLQ